MNFLTFEQHGSLNSPAIFSAFRSGVKSVGCHLVDQIQRADIAVIWSVLWQGRMAPNRQIFENFIKNGKAVIVLEVGALRRGVTWKVGINGINNEATFNHQTNHDSTRFNSMGLNLQPWSPNINGNIVICCQHTASHQWRNMPDTGTWLHQTIETVRKYSSRPIVIRPHPRQSIVGLEKLLKIKDVSASIPKKLSGTYDDFNFDQELSSAWSVINWSSNPAIQAVLKGVPAFTGPDSLAAPVSENDLKNIENPTFFDRQSWANDIVYTEWTVDEIAQGLPLIQLKSVLEKYKS